MMTMTTAQAAITIGAVVLGTMLTRFLPFLIFPEGKRPRLSFSGWALFSPMRSLAYWSFTV